MHSQSYSIIAKSDAIVGSTIVDHPTLDPANSRVHLKANESYLPQACPIEPTQAPSANDQTHRETMHMVLTRPTHPQQPPWRLSFLQIGPLAGLAALFCAFLQILASYAILAASNGDPIDTWNVQPTVFLAIFTALGNKAMAFAAIQGTIVTFWLRALKGTTLGQLHRDWGFGLYTYKALMSGRNFNILALACICGTFVAIDGPLLQRASSVRLAIPDQEQMLHVSITPELPSYWSGLIDFLYNPKLQPIDFQTPFIQTFDEWIKKAPIRSGVTGCRGSCRATVRAPALAVNHCSSDVTTHNFTEPATTAKFEQVMSGSYSLHDWVFSNHFLLLNGTAEAMTYTTYLSDLNVSQTCVGGVNRTTCTLVSAIADYDVIISNGEITFDQPPSYPRIVSRANNTAITAATVQQYGLDKGVPGDYNGTRSTLAGLCLAASIRYFVRQGLVVYHGGSPTLAPPVTAYVFQHMSDLTNAANIGHNFCAPLWQDPRDGVMASLNELAFRIGVDTASMYNDTFLESRIDEGIEIRYNVTGRITSAIEVYHANFSWFAAAASLEVFCIVAILLTFYGYWDLGRHFTFSPLEIARAFEAPLLQGVPSNVGGNGIAELEGARIVQYGVRVKEKSAAEDADIDSPANLAMADKECVQRPIGHMKSLSEYWHRFKFDPRNRRSNVQFATGREKLCESRYERQA